MRFKSRFVYGLAKKRVVLTFELLQEFLQENIYKAFPGGLAFHERSA